MLLCTYIYFSTFQVSNCRVIEMANAILINSAIYRVQYKFAKGKQGRQDDKVRLCLTLYLYIVHTCKVRICNSILPMYDVFGICICLIPNIYVDLQLCQPYLQMGKVARVVFDLISLSL